MKKPRHPEIRIPVALDAMTIVYVEEWADIMGVTREQALGELVKIAIAQHHPDLKEAMETMSEEDTSINFDLPSIPFFSGGNGEC